MSHTANADFQLILRVFLRPGPTGTGVVDSLEPDNTTHYYHESVAWATGELEKFREMYKKVALTAWSNKCWLVPPSSYTNWTFRTNRRRAGNVPSAISGAGEQLRNTL